MGTHNGGMSARLGNNPELVSSQDQQIISLSSRIGSGQPKDGKTSARSHKGDSEGWASARHRDGDGGSARSHKGDGEGWASARHRDGDGGAARSHKGDGEGWASARHRDGDGGSARSHKGDGEGWASARHRDGDGGSARSHKDRVSQVREVVTPVRISRKDLRRMSNEEVTLRMSAASHSETLPTGNI